MRKRNSSDSESSEAHESPSSSSGEDGTPVGGRNTHVEKGVSEYEKQRLSRIAANKARMEALGLPQMASSLMGSAKNSTKKKQNKGKAKINQDDDDDDDDYRPEEEEEGPTSSSDKEKDNHDYVGGKASGSNNKRKSASKKVKNTTPKSNKKASVRKKSTTSDRIDDDEALKMAIALSLQENGPSGSFDMANANVNETKGKMQTKEDSWSKKRKKSFASRLQMTEDELLIHFYQFDENWNDGISVRDIERVAIAHDFTWTDEELSDMIRCFDSDGDGKLGMDDFRKIVVRCQMLKGPEEP